MSIIKSENIKEVKKLLETLYNKFLNYLPDIVIALVILVVGILFSKLLIKIIKGLMHKTKIDPTATSFITSLVKGLVYTIVTVVFLSVLGVPMASLITVIGAAGLAIGLALQTVLSNLSGGFIILFEKPFKVGDIIESEGSRGKVDGIGILYTRIITESGDLVFIPNGKVSGGKIVNINYVGKDIEFTEEENE
ncbi:MAG: mechanosensitive ion channel [Ruminococcus sp.]|jgi:small conductance mechanosensitive channel|nr:mechanosensitive ion channel [Ruminococcus sp.]